MMRDIKLGFIGGLIAFLFIVLPILWLVNQEPKEDKPIVIYFKEIK